MFIVRPSLLSYASILRSSLMKDKLAIRSFVDKKDFDQIC